MAGARGRVRLALHGAVARERRRRPGAAPPGDRARLGWGSAPRAAAWGGAEARGVGRLRRGRPPRGRRAASDRPVAAPRPPGRRRLGAAALGEGRGAVEAVGGGRGEAGAGGDLRKPRAAVGAVRAFDMCGLLRFLLASPA